MTQVESATAALAGGAASWARYHGVEYGQPCDGDDESNEEGARRQPHRSIEPGRQAKSPAISSLSIIAAPPRLTVST